MTETGKLTASDPAGLDRFGWSVSPSGGAALIGAIYGDDGGTDSGSACVFERPADGWASMTKTANLTASDAATWDYFGASDLISGPMAVVGAYSDDAGEYGSSSAYMFEEPPAGLENTTETAKLTASDAAASDVFGISVSIWGEGLARVSKK